MIRLFKNLQSDPVLISRKLAAVLIRAPEMSLSKILVVIRFYRFSKWQCNFAINGKSSAETILPFELFPPLPAYTV